MTDFAELTDQIAALEANLGSTTGVMAAFDGELARMQESLVFTGREVGVLATGFSGGLRRAFDGVVFDGVKLSDALRGLADSLSRTVLNTALKPISGAFGGFLAGGLNNILSNVMPFAKGGVVSRPTGFGMTGGAGLMGEAGPEAILPLTRGADGRLGVAGGGRPVTVVMNISTPDVQGFQRSQSQIAAQAMRALARGQRNR